MDKNLKNGSTSTPTYYICLLIALEQIENNRIWQSTTTDREVNKFNSDWEYVKNFKNM